MSIAGWLKVIPIVSSGVKYISGRYRSPDIDVTDSRVLPQYDRMSGPPFKPIDFRVKVENVGDMTVYDLRASIYFYGYLGDSDEPSGAITVDTMGFWEQKEGRSISLHGDESEWLNVLRVVQDYSAAANFDADSDVYLTFPTDQGWEPQGRIQMEFFDRDTPLTNNNIPRSEAKHLRWDEARIEIRGEDKNSHKIAFGHGIDMSRLRTGMDNRAGFFGTTTMSSDGGDRSE